MKIILLHLTPVKRTQIKAPRQVITHTPKSYIDHATKYAPRAFTGPGKATPDVVEARRRRQMGFKPLMTGSSRLERILDRYNDAN